MADNVSARIKEYPCPRCDGLMDLTLVDVPRHALEELLGGAGAPLERRQLCACCRRELMVQAGTLDPAEDERRHDWSRLNYRPTGLDHLALWLEMAQFVTGLNHAPLLDSGQDSFVELGPAENGMVLTCPQPGGKVLVRLAHDFARELGVPGLWPRPLHLPDRHACLAELGNLIDLLRGQSAPPPQTRYPVEATVAGFAPGAMEQLQAVVRPAPSAAPLTGVDVSILAVLDASRPRALSYRHIVGESVRLEREDRTKMRRLADSAIRARVPVLISLGLVARPDRTQKQGVAITDKGLEALRAALANSTETQRKN
jgi:hypothetical protein